MLLCHLIRHILWILMRWLILKEPALLFYICSFFLFLSLVLSFSTTFFLSSSMSLAVSPCISIYFYFPVSVFLSLSPCLSRFSSLPVSHPLPPVSPLSLSSLTSLSLSLSCTHPFFRKFGFQPEIRKPTTTCRVSFKTWSLCNIVKICIIRITS